MGLYGVYSYEKPSVADLHKAIERNALVQIFAAFDQMDSKRKQYQ
jgi:hypothetical protein